MKRGRTLRLRVTVQEENGAFVSSRSVTFTSSDPALATVSSGGLVQVSDPGKVTLTVEGYGGNAEAELEIRSGGGLRIPELAAVDRLLIEFLEMWDIPGAVVGVTYGERLVFRRGYGVSDRDLVSYVVFLNSRGSSPNAAASELGSFLGAPLRAVGFWPPHDLFVAPP